MARTRSFTIKTGKVKREREANSNSATRFKGVNRNVPLETPPLVPVRPEGYKIAEYGCRDNGISRKNRMLNAQLKAVGGDTIRLNRKNRAVNAALKATDTAVTTSDLPKVLKAFEAAPPTAITFAEMVSGKHCKWPVTGGLFCGDTVVERPRSGAGAFAYCEHHGSIARAVTPLSPIRVNEPRRPTVEVGDDFDPADLCSILVA